MTPETANTLQHYVNQLAIQTGHLRVLEDRKAHGSRTITDEVIQNQIARVRLTSDYVKDLIKSETKSETEE